MPNDKKNDAAGEVANWWVRAQGNSITVIQSDERPSRDAAPGEPMVRFYGGAKTKADAEAVADKYRAKLRK